jgi:hypothetical protein
VLRTVSKAPETVPIADTLHTVHRKSFWDTLRPKIRASSARLVCDVMRLADSFTGPTFCLIFAP